jgi:hypothetical protein
MTWQAMRAIIAMTLGLCPGGAAHAIIVGNVPGIVPATTVNPLDYAGWTQGDPGWDNTTAGGSNYVYLGDGWVLSARHVGYSATNGVTLQTRLSDGSPGPVQTFYRIPGSYYYDYGYLQGSTRYYAVSNPTTIQSESGQTISLADSRGTYFTDLQLFRINGDPGLPALTIASQPLPNTFTPGTAPEVVAIGRGRGRATGETHWNVTVIPNGDPDGSDHWTWTSTTGAGNYQGYGWDGIVAKRFGTNRLTDPATTNYVDLFAQESGKSGVVSNTTAVLSLPTGDGITRDVISMMTVFDNQSTAGNTPLEFQGVSGDSGSGVFYKRGEQWELAGILHATSIYEDQAVSRAVYGNATLISDLSYYNQNYVNSIRDIIDSHSDYSMPGDVNLDGVVSGDGTGLPGADDVTDFVLGWGFDNGTGLGNITSWKNGDLSRDGKTDVGDFLMLRGALNGQISSAVMEALFGSSYDGGHGGVPEPASAALAGIAALWFCIGRRGRE